MNFKDCNLIDPILKALSEQGYTEPTAIQAGAIRPALEGRDVLGIARTGTGKTCAFAAPILQRLNTKPAQGRPIRALVLTPTRELAIQNQECFESYGSYLPLKSVVIFGGVGQNPQVEAIQKGADILVATPGRLADLYQQKLLDLSRLEIFVLDEADRMLDMGFIHDVKKILKWLPRRKQTLFFSATMPDEITELVQSLLHHPVRVAVDPVNTTVDAIAQTVYKVDRGNKTRLLVHLLNEQQLPSVLVFTRTKHGANKVSRDLEKAKISSAAIHGNKSQTARQQALAGFKEGKIRVLVATDIAARGLDIEDLACVVNYNLPEVPETYVHRIGRTGRAGREGIAIALCDYQELPLLKEIEKLTRKQIPEVKDHPWPMENFEEAVRDRNGKIRNPEDEEARSAARERAKNRNAARQQSGSSASAKPTAEKQHQPVNSDAEKRKKENQPENRGGKAAQSAAAPKKAAKKGKNPQQTESLGVVPIPDLLPKRDNYHPEPERSYDTSDILKRKYKRPERKVIPSLSSVSLLPQVELKETFTRKSDLLQLDRPVKKLPKGDATSRLFAERKELPTQPEPEKAESSGKKRSGRKAVKKSAAAPAPKKQPTSGSAPSAAAKAPSKGASAKKEQRVVFTVAKEESRQAGEKRNRQKRRSGERPRFSDVRPASRQKDSTEQKSLMKPYYLSDRRKG